MKGLAEASHSNIEVLKDWLSDMAENISLGQNTAQKNVDCKLGSLKTCMDTLSKVNDQLDTLKGLLVNALKVRLLSI